MAERTANLNIRTDSNLKKEAEELFKSLGLNLTTAVNMFLAQSVRNREIPFMVTMNTPNKETLEALEEAKYILKHPEEYKSYNSMEDLKKALLED